ncbi:hypothetical protein VOLCADRAFT_100341 [Volvox carteri f. nagariensis]|uniref:Uncharacterized protein n=1 Tax=Volvox carteri f. nagariensis TaxID=3068 RepID=D8UK12_VOLCA|nr:uncharacterized protein VOLCADRAFT_100341 [Volvox carteri f. nagariensis]EFJ39917.1 hypothetical protein VOLCADRAFT_100341 [Volvox carteri f. nagariensis]|eukprot:XP_002958998.1 hypothetical protein VOLCADRAFT_100341 [Volvox carteri f. nagariensis]
MAAIDVTLEDIVDDGDARDQRTRSPNDAAEMAALTRCLHEALGGDDERVEAVRQIELLRHGTCSEGRFDTPNRSIRYPVRLIQYPARPIRHPDRPIRHPDRPIQAQHSPIPRLHSAIRIPPHGGALLSPAA